MLDINIMLNNKIPDKTNIRLILPPPYLNSIKTISIK